MSARVHLPEPLDKLLRSQLETAIYESALHRDDELIAKRRIIDKWGQNITPTGSNPSRGIFLRKYRHGGRGDTGLVHVAALPTDLLIF